MFKKFNLNIVAVSLFALCLGLGFVPDAEAALAGLAVMGNTSLLAEMRQDRGTAIKAARDLNDKVLAEKRSMTAEETAQYDGLIDKQAELQASIERTENQLKLDREMAAFAMADEGAAGAVRKATGAEAAMEVHMQAFVMALKSGYQALNPTLKAALDTTTVEGGGALVAPQEFVADLIKAVDDVTFIRGLANVMTITGTDSLGQPSLDNDPADADWTSELATGSEDSTMSFGGRELTPQPLAKRIKVSNTLLRRSAIPVEQIVRDRLAYKFGITEEKAFLTGSGSNQPLGVFTASAKGISTGRDVAAASATVLVGDDLINVKYSLKGQYWPRAQWIFGRDVMKALVKLKDTTNQYIFRTGLVQGEPDRLLDMPVNVSEYAPVTMTSGLYVGVLGDFSQYYIVEEAGYSLQRLSELYAEANQTGYIARTHIDGMPVQEEAFARLKMG